VGRAQQKVCADSGGNRLVSAVVGLISVIPGEGRYT
jgi:hypothetical protein